MAEKTIGLIGCGLIADTHVEAIKAVLPDYEISACDPQPGKANLLVKKYSLKNSYTSVAEMLSIERPFCVHVLSPPQYHVEHVIASLKAGCHVIVEKPIAFKVNYVAKLYDLSREYDRLLCVDHSLLYQPSVQKMFHKAHTSFKDEILHVNCFYGLDVDSAPVSALPAAHWKQQLPGGTIIDTLIHPVTLAIELSGAPKEIKIEFLGTVDDPKELRVYWSSGRSMVSIIISSNAQPFQRVTEVITKRETFIIDHSTETLVHLAKGSGPKAMKKVVKNFSHSYQLASGTIATIMKVVRGKLRENPGARELIKLFYNNLLKGGPLPVSTENVQNSTYVLEKIVEQISFDKIEIFNNKPVDCRVNDIKGSVAIKTLVTGASGFLGSALCEHFSKTGERHIIAQVRRGANADKVGFSNVFTVYEDFSSGDTDYENLVKDVKEIIHCAHASGAKTWMQFKRMNVDASVSLYEAAAKAGCVKFIFISSVAVYGVHQKGRVQLDENSPSTLGRSKWDFYIRSKTLAERALLERSKSGGPKLLIIRPGILYGSNGSRLTRKSFPTQDGRLFVMLGSGENFQPFTRVDVLAEAICKAIRVIPFPEGIYNMSGFTDENNEDFIAARLGKIGLKSKFLHLPVFPFRIIAFILEHMYSLSMRKTPPPITRYIIDSSVRDVYYDCSKAQKTLGWDPQKAVTL